MAMKTSDRWYGCPVRFGAAAVGDAWSLAILRDLIFMDARRYADFLRADEGIATNILAGRLVHLEKEGIIRKSPDPDHAGRHHYMLTEKGLELVPVVLEIMAWSIKWDPQTEAPEGFRARLSADRAGLTAEILARLRSGAASVSFA